MQVLTREFLLCQFSWLFGPKNGSNGAINLYKYQFNPQKLGLSTSLTLTETLGNNLERKKVSSKTRSNGLHYYHQGQLTSSCWNACNAHRFEQEGKMQGRLGWRKRVISDIHFKVFFFFLVWSRRRPHTKNHILLEEERVFMTSSVLMLMHDEISTWYLLFIYSRLWRTSL